MKRYKNGEVKFIQKRKSRKEIKEEKRELRIRDKKQSEKKYIINE